MGTMIEAMRKAKLVHGNKLNATEKKQNIIKTVSHQLDQLYGNPLRFENKIKSLETRLTLMRR